MAFQIGFDSDVGNTYIFGRERTNTSNHQLLSLPAHAYTAVAGDYVDTVTFRVGTNVGDGTNGVEVGIYDVTDGIATAPLISSTTIAVLTADSNNPTSIPPVYLTAGRTYAMGFRVASTTAVSVMSREETANSKWSARTGAVPLDDWNDNNTDGLRFNVTASGDNDLTAIAGSDYFLDLSSIVDTADFPAAYGVANGLGNPELFPSTLTAIASTSIVSGSMRPSTPSTSSGFRITTVPDAPVKASVILSGTVSSDSVGPALVDSSGNGFFVRCSDGTSTRIYALVANTLSGGSLTSTDQVFGDGTLVELTQVDGQIVGTVNGTSIGSISDGGATGLFPAALTWSSGGYTIGISAFGANYLAIPPAYVSDIDESDMFIDVSAAGDQNPYVNTDVSHDLDGLKILDGCLKPIGGGDGYGGITLLAATTASVISVAGIIGEWDDDEIYLSLLNGSGTGYTLQLSTSGARIRGVTAHLENTIYATTAVTIEVGDEFKFEQGGGEFRSYHNGVLLDTISDGSTTGLKPSYGNYGSSSMLSGLSKVGFNYLAPIAEDPSINPTGTDTEGQVGDTNSVVVIDLDGATPVSVALYDAASGRSTTQADFVWTSGTSTVTYTVTRGTLPYSDTLELRVTLDDDEVLTLSDMSLLIEDDYQVIVAAGTLVFGTDESIISSYEGDDPEVGYQIRAPLLTEESGELTINPDLTFSIEYPGSPPASDSIELELWDTLDWESFSRTITIGEDVVPADFTLTDVTDVELSTLTISNTIEVEDVASGEDIDISITNGEYSVDTGSGFGAWTSTATTVQLGYFVRVRATSSASYNTLLSPKPTLTIGTVSSTWDITTRIADVIPAAFTLTSVADVELSALTTSNTVEVEDVDSGVDVDVSIANGEYSVNSGAGFGAWTSVAGVVQLGDLVRVRATSSASYNTLLSPKPTLTIGTVNATWDITTRIADVVPAAFTLTSVTDAVRSTEYISTSVQVQDVDSGLAIDVSVANGEYSVNSGAGFGAWTSVASTVEVGYLVRVRATSSGSYSTLLTPKPTLTIGTVSATWDITTGVADVVPTAFTLTSVTDATISTEYVSNTITVAGVDSGVDVDISITAGEYSINTGSGFGSWTSADGVVQLGHLVRVRATSSIEYSTLLFPRPTLTIGTVDATWDITTLVGNNIVSVNSGAIVTPNLTFPVVFFGINANDVTMVVFERDEESFLCNIVNVDSDTQLTALSPSNLPTSGGPLTIRVFESKHSREVRLILDSANAILDELEDTLGTLDGIYARYDAGAAITFQRELIFDEDVTLSNIKSSSGVTVTVDSVDKLVVGEDGIDDLTATVLSGTVMYTPGGSSGGLVAGTVYLNKGFVYEGDTPERAMRSRTFFVDTSAAVVNIILPSAPYIGLTYTVIDMKGTFATNNCVIHKAASGANIMGLDESMTISSNNASATFIYSGDPTSGWRIKY